MLNAIKINGQLACYVPAFFSIEINQFSNFDDIYNSESKLSTLIHEYVHFMQDFLTAYGVNNIRNYYILLSHLAVHAKKANTKELPILIPNDDNFCYDFDKTFKLTYGDICNIQLPANAKIEKFYTAEEFEGKIPVPIYHISYNNGIKIQLGAIHIFEGMAYLIEKTLFKDKAEPSPDIPYSVIVHLAEIFSPAILKRKDLLIALCEVSLAFSHPMQFFVECLDDLKGVKEYNMTLDDFVSMITKNLTAGSYEALNGDEAPETLSNSFLKIHNSAKEKVNDILNMEYFDEVRNWINTIFDNAFKIKKNDFIPLTRLILRNNPLDHFLDLVTKELGCPAIYFGNTGITVEQKNATKDVFLFNVLHNVFNCLANGKCCTLKNKCKKIAEEFKTPECVNEYCETQPFRKITEDSICPFAIIWRYFGLGDDWCVKQI